jgi:hypothetical protein
LSVVQVCRKHAKEHAACVALSFGGLMCSDMEDVAEGLEIK